MTGRQLISQSLATLDGYVGGLHDELDWHRVDPARHAVINATQCDISGYGGPPSASSDATTYPNRVVRLHYSCAA